jgi:hypothetical protein
MRNRVCIIVIVNIIALCLLSEAYFVLPIVLGIAGGVIAGMLMKNDMTSSVMAFLCAACVYSVSAALVTTIWIGFPNVTMVAIAQMICGSFLLGCVLAGVPASLISSLMRL